MTSTELHNEKGILLQLIQGSDQAFEIIYHFYSPKLYFKLLRLLRSESLAQEILQDIFLEAWKNRERIDTNKSFRSYLFCIATNKAYDFFRKAGRDKKLLEQLMHCRQEYCKPAETIMIDKEDAGNLHQAIALLPPKRRLVFILCKVNGKSYDEVSQQLGISPSTISDHIVKANHFLKDYLLRLEQ